MMKKLLSVCLCCISYSVVGDDVIILGSGNDVRNIDMGLIGASLVNRISAVPSVEDNRRVMGEYVYRTINNRRFALPGRDDNERRYTLPGRDTLGLGILQILNPIRAAFGLMGFVNSFYRGNTNNPDNDMREFLKDACIITISGATGAALAGGLAIYLAPGIAVLPLAAFAVVGASCGIALQHYLRGGSGRTALIIVGAGVSIAVVIYAGHVYMSQVDPSTVPPFTPPGGGGVPVPSDSGVGAAAGVPFADPSSVSQTATNATENVADRYFVHYQNLHNPMNPHPLNIGTNQVLIPNADGFTLDEIARM